MLQILSSLNSLVPLQEFMFRTIFGLQFFIVYLTFTNRFNQFFSKCWWGLKNVGGASFSIGQSFTCLEVKVFYKFTGKSSEIIRCQISIVITHDSWDEISLFRQIFHDFHKLLSDGQSSAMLFQYRFIWKSKSSGELKDLTLFLNS